MIIDWVQQSDHLRKINDAKISRQKESNPERKFPFDYSYFENRDCLFWKCHDVDYERDGFNCMFCRCPYYYKANCPGIENGDGLILKNGAKDCVKCDYNHRYENRQEMGLVHLDKLDM